MDNANQMMLNKYKHEIKEVTLKVDQIIKFEYGGKINKLSSFGWWLIKSIRNRFNQPNIELPLLITITGQQYSGKTLIAQDIRNHVTNENKELKTIWIDLKESKSIYPEKFTASSDFIDLLDVIYSVIRDENIGTHFKEFSSHRKYIKNIEENISDGLSTINDSNVLDENQQRLQRILRGLVLKYGPKILSKVSESSENSIKDFLADIPEPLAKDIEDISFSGLKSLSIYTIGRFINSKEEKDFLNSTDRLVTLFLEGLRRANKESPLMIVFDSLENIHNFSSYISWITKVIIQSPSSVIWMIISQGRYTQFESNHSINLQPIEILHLDKHDISKIFNNHPKKIREIYPREITAIFTITGGNLYQVHRISSIWYPGHEDITLLDTLYEQRRTLNQLFITKLREIVNSTDKQALTLLSIAYLPEKTLISLILKDSLIQQDELINKYPSLFINNNKIDFMVGRAFRESLYEQSKNEKFVKLAVEQAINYHNKKIGEINTKYDMLSQRNLDRSWRRHLISILYYCFWLDPEDSQKIFVDYMMQILLFEDPVFFSSLSEELGKELGTIYHDRNDLTNILELFDSMKAVQFLAPTISTYDEDISKFKELGLIVKRSKDTESIEKAIVSRISKFLKVIGEIEKSDENYLIDLIVDLYSCYLSIFRRQVRVAYHHIAQCENLLDKLNDMDLAELIGNMYQLIAILIEEDSSFGSTHLTWYSRHDLGISCIQKAIELLGENTFRIYIIASLYLDVNDIEQSIFWSNKLIGLDPNSYLGYNLKAIALGKDNKELDAIEIYTEALTLVPRDDPALITIFVNLALGHIHLENLDKAKHYIDKALNSNSENAIAQVVKARLIVEIDKITALDLINNATETVTIVTNSFISNLMFCLAIFGDDISINTINRLLNRRDIVYLQKTDAMIHYLLGEILLRTNETNLAVMSLKHATHVAPREIYSYLSLSKAYVKLNMFDSALDEIAKMSVINRNAALAFSLQGLSEVGQKTKNQFRRASRKSVPPKKRNTVFANINSASTYILNNNYVKAKEQLDIAVRKSEKNGWLYYLLALVNLEMGNHLDAIANFEESLIRQQKGRQFHMHTFLGQIYSTQHQYEEALFHYKKALEDLEECTFPTQEVKASILLDVLLIHISEGNNEETSDICTQIIHVAPESFEGRIAQLIKLVNSKQIQEARLEFRRLHKDAKLENVTEFTKTIKWKNNAIRDQYYRIVESTLYRYVIQGALILGDLEEIKRVLFEYFDLIGEDVRSQDQEIMDEILSLVPDKALTSGDHSISPHSIMRTVYTEWNRRTGQ